MSETAAEKAARVERQLQAAFALQRKQEQAAATRAANRRR